MSEFNVSEVWAVLKPLTLLVLELAGYTIFVFAFYRFFGKRDIIKLNLNPDCKPVGKFLRIIFFVIEDILLFPVIVSFWFAMLVVFLALLGKNQQPENILLIAIAVVGTTRCTAYFNERLSSELAKLLPLTVFGIYIIDRSFFEMESSLGILRDMPDQWRLILTYAIFALALEFLLMIGHGMISSLQTRKQA